MKRKLTSYFAGVLTALVLGTITMSAFAAGGVLTLTVTPIRVMVNGQVFQPRDAQGNEVYVFQANGTTYVPLRALSEAYGLEVGYDAGQNMATVSGPVRAPAKTESDFLSVWTVKEKPVTGYGDERIFTASYSGSLGMTDFKVWWKSFDQADIERWAEQVAADALSSSPGGTVTMYFDYQGYMLGTVLAQGDYLRGNFRLAGVWIK